MGYEPGSSSQDAAPDGPLASAARELLAADRAYAARALEAGEATASREFLDERAVELPVRGGPVAGRDGIARRLEEGPRRVRSWEPRYAEVLAPGDWGWTWGEWQLHEPGAGGVRIGTGKYLSLWKRQPDGSWKVRVDMDGQEPPPATPAP